MRPPRLLLPLVTVLALALPGVAVAQTFSYKDTLTTPISFGPSPACKEAVILTGTQHMEIQSTVSDGKVHMQSTVKENLTGVGVVSGAKYQGVRRYTHQTNGSLGANGRSEYNMGSSVLMIRNV